MKCSSKGAITMEKLDLLVIGAGMAGIGAANKCGSRGWSVAIVDALPYGGTCALRGCDPKKILRRGAEIIDSARAMRGKGIDDRDLTINWGDLMKHKRGFTDEVPAKMERGLAGNGVTTLHGNATFDAPNRVTIDGTQHEARNILIATGARPRPLTFPGHEYLTDSTGFLSLENLPSRVMFIGGGFVSFEFAHLAVRAGSSVVIVDRGDRALKEFDPDLVELLADHSFQLGIELLRRTTVAKVIKVDSGYRVTLDRAGVLSESDVDLVVHGAGRVPDVAALGLDRAEVESGPRGITVSGHLQSTTNPAVWAAGDAASTRGMPLTPVAVFEGKVAAANMLTGTTTVPDYTGIPTTVFTIPELTRVGMREEDARTNGLNVDVRYTDTGAWYSNYRVGQPVAATKILIDRSTDRIVGAHLFGPDYGELVNVIALAMKLGLTTRQLKSAVASYPSVGSDLGALL